MIDIYNRLKQINQAKHRHDSVLSDMQRATDKITKKELNQKQMHQQQSQIAQLFNQIKLVCQKNGEQLTEIKVQLMKIRTHEKLDVNRQEQLYENLVEYFNHLLENARRLYNISSEKLQQMQKTRLMGNNMYDVNDQTHLDGSHRSAGEAVQISREIEGSLLYQQSRLENIRARLGNFVGELNISKTLTRMIANRSKQDYKLIIVLAVLLFIEIFVCYFYVRPWIKS